MSEGFTIRPARRDDEPTLGRLGLQMVVEHHDFDPERFIAPAPDTAERYGGFLASQIGQPDKWLLVAEADGQPVAYIFAGLEGPDYMALRGPAGAIYDVIVDVRYRRRGIGRALLDTMFHEQAQRGAARTVLSTATKNLGAQALFKAAGFRSTMVEMTRERDPVD